MADTMQRTSDVAAAPQRRSTVETSVHELRRAGLTAIVLLALLNIADVVITRLLLTRGGIELNPLADRLLASNTELVVKLALVVALVVHFLRHGPRLPVVCLMWLVSGLYLCVVVIDGSQLVANW